MSKGVLVSNLAMNVILFGMIFKSIYMIKQSLNHQLESQVELRKILKYNPTQLYLFGVVALLWILFLIIGLTLGPTIQEIKTD